VETDSNELAKNYATMSDDELLELYSAGTLTDVAYQVLEAELSRRGIAIPQRHEAPQGRPQSLRAHWQGRASLASAYWLIGVLGGIVVSTLLTLAVTLVDSTLVHLLVLLAWITYDIFALVSIWRCAWNTSWKGWGYMARAVVLLGVLGYLAVVAALVIAVLPDFLEI
jgi:hypothetical protein